jgi:GH15 family glucan-1,4-alpha-glucosidase
MDKKLKSPLTYQRLINQHIKILQNLQYKSGLFAASDKEVGTGYDRSWLRDNFYECLAFQVLEDWDSVERTYDALLKIFLKHEPKIDYAITHKPEAKHEYIHARFNPETFEEFWEEWGNKQNDSIGAILFNVGRLEHHHKRSVLETPDHIRIINKLVEYLATIEYWHDVDHGIWEFDEEVHASSIGACVAGLKQVDKLKAINVPGWLIEKGEVALDELLPRESELHFVDLALLSLIWPYDVVSTNQRNDILKNVEYHLLKERGVVRYKNDWYYNKNPDGFSEEAEWTFGLSWLAIIYSKLGNKNKAKFYIDKMIKTATPKGVPELYYSHTNQPNENNSLGWAESLFVVALHEMNDRFLKYKHNYLPKKESQ